MICELDMIATAGYGDKCWTGLYHKDWYEDSCSGCSGNCPSTFAWLSDNSAMGSTVCNFFSVVDGPKYKMAAYLEPGVQVKAVGWSVSSYYTSCSICMCEEAGAKKN